MFFFGCEMLFPCFDSCRFSLVAALRFVLFVFFPFFPCPSCPSLGEGTNYHYVEIASFAKGP